MRVRVSSFLFAILLAGVGAPGNAREATQPPSLDRTEYNGIRPTDPDGRIGIRNPERGFRIETLIAEPAGAGAWGLAAHLRNRAVDAFHPNNWLRDARRFEPDGLTLVQAYCYLTDYCDGPIPEEKLRLLCQAPIL